MRARAVPAAPLRAPPLAGRRRCRHVAPGVGPGERRSALPAGRGGLCRRVGPCGAEPGRPVPARSGGADLAPPGPGPEAGAAHGERGPSAARQHETPALGPGPRGVPGPAMPAWAILPVMLPAFTITGMWIV